eukprot:SAG31_NODE_3577_length_4103_cov_2.362637_3_plen_127_part_00
MKADPQRMWIIKPIAGSQGAGIRIINGESVEIFDRHEDVNRNCIVQTYIGRPHLIGGFKYDLRLYVMVPGWRPLRGYLHRQGLVRFAVALYDAGSRDPSQHLTNSSLHKNNESYVRNQVSEALHDP